MGFTYETHLGWYDNDMRMPQIIYDQQRGNCFQELLFDKSWDWLMPVVDKCDNLGFSFLIDINSKVEVLSHEGKEIFSKYGNDTLDLVYEAVIDFIKEYNKNI